MRGLFAALFIILNGGAGAEVALRPLVIAQEAAALLARGDAAAAARKTRDAMQTAPDDALITILAGAIYLQTGSAARAQTHFENVLQNSPTDALARYGLALAELAQNRRQAARHDFDLSRQSGGDAQALTLAVKYERSLEAAAPTPDTKKFAGDTSLAERALTGMLLARQGAKARAIAILESVLSEMPARFEVPPAGLRMSFAAESPFAAAARLPAGLAPDAEVTQIATMNGDVQFSPQNAPPETACVSYEIDGQPVGLINVAPYRFTLDSRTLTNGLHTLATRCCDRDGAELSATERNLRIYNRPLSPGAISEDETERTLRAALWKILTPTPDRAALASALGALQREAGQTARAEYWHWQAAAENAASPQARKNLAALGVRPASGDAFYSGLHSRREIALTFDDGPKPGLTEPLIDLLVREKVPATFFVIGRNAAANPDITRRIAQAGMELANHSYTHRNLTRLTAAEVAAEMAQTQATLYALTGQRPRFMRPPGGAWNAKVSATVRQWGLTPCFWTADVFGSEVVSSQQTAQAVIAQARPGAIVLMHNGKLSTLQALPTILRELRAEGYTFVTITTMAKHFAAGRDAERRAAQQNARKRRAE